MADTGVPDIETQKNCLKELLKKPLKKGDKWFLVDAKWFKQWKKYVEYEDWIKSYAGLSEAHPGPVNNASLLDDKGKLKEHLLDKFDYQLMPEEAWTKIMAWYGISEAQESIQRKVIELGRFVKIHIVEVYLLTIRLCENSNVDKLISKDMSREDTIGDLEKVMRSIFKIPDDKEVRLWYKYTSNTYEQLTKKEATLQDADVFSGRIIVIEQESGKWSTRDERNTNWRPLQRKDTSSHDRKKKSPKKKKIVDMKIKSVDHTSRNTNSAEAATAQMPTQNHCEICLTACGNDYCLDCTQYFCSACKTSHLRTAVCKNHRFKSSDLATSDPNVFCLDHNEAYAFICDGCQLPVCKQCTVKTHRGHVMNDIKETVAARKLEFFTLVKSALPTEDVTKLDNITAELDNYLSNINEKETKTVCSIREEGKAIKYIIDKIVEEFEKKVNIEAQDRKQELENVRLETKKAQNSIQDIRNKEEKIKLSSETIELLYEIKKLSESISEFKIHIPTLRQPSTMTFQPAQKSKEAFRDMIGVLVSSHDSDSDTTPM